MSDDWSQIDTDGARRDQDKVRQAQGRRTEKVWSLGLIPLGLMLLLAGVAWFILVLLNDGFSTFAIAMMGVGATALVGGVKMMLGKR